MKEDTAVFLLRITLNDFCFRVFYFDRGGSKMDDEVYMKLALQLAKKGAGFVNPNPMVGAVIVKDGKIIGNGYHEYFGGLHAERNALLSCSQSPEGAALYVTLEPCCHYGKTPPCTDAIIESKIGAVVVGTPDPNPLVAGKGMGLLKQKGIPVTTGVLEEECRELNQIFFHYIQNQTPYVAMKYAMTLDGKIATTSGETRWITGEAAREHVHQLRHAYSAIMVGIGTVMADDPMLNCRMAGGKNPIRVICDTNLSIPLTSKIVQTAGEIPTCIAYSCEENERAPLLREKGCQLLKTKKKDGHIDLNHLMTLLYAENIDSILLEGGAALNFSAVRSGIVRKVYAYIAPEIVGGATAKSPVGGAGIEKLKDAFAMANGKTSRLGEDFLLEYDVR